MFSSASVITSQFGPQKGETNNEDEVPNYRGGARERVCRSAGGCEEFLEDCHFQQKASQEAHEEEDRGRKHGPGSISVLDFATRKIVAEWPIPGGGSPDMGNVSADGKTLWVSGRFDNEVYAIDTTDGTVRKIPVGTEPHGLTVWPQPGRYSLGHTGNMR